MRTWSPHVYRKDGQKRGVAPDVIDAAIAARERVFAVSQALYPILTLAHLAQVTNVPYKYLRAIVSRRRDDYFVFRVHKRGRNSKDWREIAVPSLQLSWVQRWIHQEILSKVGHAPQSFAYRPGSSIVDCASRHAGCRWLIKLDIKDFFGSIYEHRIYRIFRSFGYQQLLSFEMARICTRISHSVETLKYVMRAQHTVIAGYESERAGFLPMGAPTSPMLSNLFMREFDETMQAFCAAQNVTYSRYSDDIIMSSSSAEFTRATAIHLARFCRQELRKTGLAVNSRKTVIAPPGARKVVLGLLVNDRVPRLSQEVKGRLRQHYYYIERFGLKEHADFRGFRSVGALQRHLEGLLAFCNQVEPEWTSPFRDRHERIMWPNFSRSGRA